MKIIILLISFSLLNGFVFSQTIVSGGAVSGTWTLANSPYLIQGAILIANGTSLQIEPGVRIEFQSSYKVLALGKIIAIGTVTDSIVFTTSDTAIGWLGIKYDNTSSTNDTSKFYYCKLEHVKAVAPYVGGAFYIQNFSKIIVSNSKISNCNGRNYGGGFALGYSNATIAYNIISDNSAGRGGGISIGGGNPVVSNNVIINNRAFDQYAGGGAIHCIECDATISTNLILNNSARVEGGGIYCYNAQPTILNNEIRYNSAFHGGGIFTISGFNGPTISNNIISNNTASTGGGLLCENCNIVNCIVTNNSALTNGGGIRFTSLLNQTIKNTTFSNNVAQKGGAMYCEYSSPNLSNCILWNDSAIVSGDEIYLYDEPSDPNFSNCNIEGGQSSIGVNSNVFHTGIYSNNIDSNPQFIAPSVGQGAGFNGIDADWDLQYLSPCINAGDPSGTYPATDFAGNPRIVFNRIDIGAFEYQSISSLNEPPGLNSVLIYPNPANASFFIQFNFELTNDATLKIVTILGQKIMERIIENLHSQKIQVNDITPGIYFVNIMIGANLITQKLIVN